MPSVPPKTARRVLDSHALLALLQAEPHADAVVDALEHGEPWMTLVNLGEVAYIIERERGAAAADTVWANLLADDSRLRVVPADAPLVRRAASLKARGGMSYADCFAAAAAERLDCPVLTGDPEFAAAEAAGIAVEWLGHRRS